MGRCAVLIARVTKTSRSGALIAARRPVVRVAGDDLVKVEVDGGDDPTLGNGDRGAAILLTHVDGDVIDARDLVPLIFVLSGVEGRA